MIATVIRVFAAAAVLSSGLSACGGGGPGGAAPAPAPAPAPAAATPEGLWMGNVTLPGKVYSLMLVMLGDGTYYGLYGNGSATLGLLQGAAQSDNAAVLSTNGRDFTFGTGQPFGFTLVGEYAQKATLKGVATYPAPINSSATFAFVTDRRNGATDVRRNGASNRWLKRHPEGVKTGSILQPFEGRI